MTPTELRAALARLGLSQSQAARELDIPERMFRYFCAGRYPCPRYLELSLAYLLLVKETDHVKSH